MDGWIIRAKIRLNPQLHLHFYYFYFFFIILNQTYFTSLEIFLSFLTLHFHSIKLVFGQGQGCQITYEKGYSFNISIHLETEIGRSIGYPFKLLIASLNQTQKSHPFKVYQHPSQTVILTNPKLKANVIFNIGFELPLFSHFGKLKIGYVSRWKCCCLVIFSSRISNPVTNVGHILL